MSARWRALRTRRVRRSAGATCRTLAAHWRARHGIGTQSLPGYVEAANWTAALYYRHIKGCVYQSRASFFRDTFTAHDLRSNARQRPANTRQGGQHNATGLIAEHRHALYDTRDLAMACARAVNSVRRCPPNRSEDESGSNQARGVALPALARIGGTLPGIRAQIPQHNPAKTGCLCRVAPASERQARDTLGRTSARGARY
ncbi:hypothetical protein B0H17DRAFT_1149674 [Mycena rosella]|uniref:Uncharacterized protein n=1 Tax=Mycena rosella TaxID=1033263 RepID=A0AAD7FPA7_MYCRO|nr:hypothetical protein B0H17DRAFT_1149674 [Mycena rosella]